MNAIQGIFLNFLLNTVKYFYPVYLKIFEPLVNIIK